MRIRSVTLALTCASLSIGAHETPSAPPVIERFLSKDEIPLTEYRAIRSLTASTRGGRMRASLVARTELTSSGVFRYEVISEEGSGVIRRKVLRAALEAERKSRENGDSRSAALTPENYEFAREPELEGNLLRIDLEPRRKHVMLLRGAMFLTQDSEDLVRIQGRLSKRPSFWTRRVDVVRRYERLGGVRVPIAMESTAQVLLVGRSTFSMTYDYQTVNGQPVSKEPPAYGDPAASTDLSDLLPSGEAPSGPSTPTSAP